MWPFKFEAKYDTVIHGPYFRIHGNIHDAWLAKIYKITGFKLIVKMWFEMKYVTHVFAVVYHLCGGLSNMEIPGFPDCLVSFTCIWVTHDSSTQCSWVTETKKQPTISCKNIFWPTFILNSRLLLYIIVTNEHLLLIAGS